MAFAIVVLLVSLTLVKNLIYIADGMLLGGILNLLYSIVRGFESQDNMFRFLVVSTGLAIALILGYVKFIKPSKVLWATMKRLRRLAQRTIGFTTSRSAFTEMPQITGRVHVLDELDKLGGARKSYKQPTLRCTSCRSG